MEESVRNHMESRQSAAASRADATVHVTTWSPAPSPDTAAQLGTAKQQRSCSSQQDFTWAPELKLPAPQTANASHAAVEVAADNPVADLQHMSTSDLQDFCLGQNSLSAQDVIRITAVSDGPALTQISSGYAQQLDSGIATDDAETMLHNADQVSTGVSMPHGTAALDITCDSSILYESPDLMETSIGYGEHEASLCCHLDSICCNTNCCKNKLLTYKLYQSPNVIHNLSTMLWLVICRVGCRQPQMQTCSR